MAEFEVMPGKLREQAGNLNDISRMLRTYGQGISSVSRNLSGAIGGPYAIIFSTLLSIMEQLQQNQQSTDSMHTVLMRVAERYLNAETKIVDAAGKKETIEHPDSFLSFYASSNAWNAAADSDGSLDPLTGRWTGNAYANASVWEGSAGFNIGNGLYQFDAKGTALGAHAEAEAELDPFKISAGASAGAAALNGTITQSTLWGVDQCEAEGSVLGAEAEAKGYLSWLGVAGSAEAWAAVAKGEAEQTLGLDKYHVQGGAEGAVLGAGAEASAGIGMYQDKDGNTQMGMHASAGAEAYVAKGEVKGGVTLFGIEVNASFGGQIGAGASAEAEVSANSVKVGGSLAALLGISGEIEIDWSDFGFW